jgi:hypothetical protein
MLTGSTGPKFHGTTQLRASYVRTETGADLFIGGAGVGPRQAGEPGAEGCGRGLRLLFRQRPQPAQGPVLGDPYGAR